MPHQQSVNCLMPAGTAGTRTIHTALNAFLIRGTHNFVSDAAPFVKHSTPDMRGNYSTVTTNTFLRRVFSPGWLVEPCAEKVCIVLCLFLTHTSRQPYLVHIQTIPERHTDKQHA